MSVALSVVIATCGRTRELERCLDGTLPQLRGEDEVIVVDQNRGGAPLRRPGVRTIVLRRANLPAARNAGMRAARNAVLLFLDDDARPAPGCLEVHRRAHTRSPRNGVAGRIRQEWSGGACVAAIDPATFETAGNFNSETAVMALYACGCHMSFPRGAALALGGFNPRFRGNALYEDVDFSLRFTARGGAIGYEPAAVVDHDRCRSGGCRSRAGVAYLLDRIHNWLLFVLLHGGVRLSSTQRAHLKNLVEYTTRLGGGNHSPAIALQCLGSIAAGYIDAFLSPRPPRLVHANPLFTRAGMAPGSYGGVV